MAGGISKSSNFGRDSLCNENVHRSFGIDGTVILKNFFLFDKVSVEARISVEVPFSVRTFIDLLESMALHWVIWKNFFLFHKKKYSYEYFYYRRD